MVSRAAADSGHAAKPAAEAVAVDEFGLSKVQVDARKPAPVQEAPKVELVTSRAKTLQRRATGEMIVTLENGQTWLQTDTGPSLGFRVGDQMSIRTAALGSYMLSAPGHSAIRVRRIR